MVMFFLGTITNFLRRLGGEIYEKEKILMGLTAAVMASTMALTGCGSGSTGGKSSGSDAGNGEIKEFSLFISEPTTVERTEDNEVKQLIAEKTGVRIKETYLTGQTSEEAVGTIIAGGDYPDLINGGGAMKELYDAGVLIPLDDYIGKYPNLKEFYTEHEWDNIRQDDGKVIDYNTTDTAKKYFQKLNEEYKKGIVDPESFTQTYDEYIAKLSTGRVLGMVDQWWDFSFSINDVFKQQDTEKYGYNYIPCPLTIEKGMENQWYTSGGEKNVASGIAITTACDDPELALYG